MKSKDRITVRMPHDLNKLLTDESEKIGISKNALVLQILWKRVKEEQQNAKECTM